MDALACYLVSGTQQCSNAHRGSGAAAASPVSSDDGALQPAAAATTPTPTTDIHMVVAAQRCVGGASYPFASRQRAREGAWPLLVAPACAMRAAHP